MRARASRIIGILGSVACLMRVFSFRLGINRHVTRPIPREEARQQNHLVFRRAFSTIPSINDVPFLYVASNPLESDCNNEGVANLNSIQERITRLNNGVSINANSPKQVSHAIFGRPHRTSRDVLQQAARGDFIQESGEPLTEAKQRLAALVLEYRDRHRCRNSGESKGTSSELDTKESTTIDTNKSPKKVERLQANDSSQFEIGVDSLFDKEQCQIPDFWRAILKQVTRPSARALVDQLDAICPMGFNPSALPHDPLRGTASPVSTTAGKKGSFLGYCREMKAKHPECILLTRCGDFFESFGVDAILLVEHYGLNPMGGKAKAGFPFVNIQAALDCLVKKGFKVAVYEEATDTDASPGVGARAGSKSRLKTRMLAQIVTPASPTYMYNLVLLGNTADTLATALPARPYMGVLSFASGYTLVEVSVEERSVRVSERLTAEAVASSLAASPPASPLLVVPDTYSSQQSTRQLAPYLPAASNDLSIKVILPSLVPETKEGVSDIELARKIVVSSLLEMTEMEDGEVDDFQLVGSLKKRTNDAQLTPTSPLHLETATQLGLHTDKSIPPLMSYVLPNSAPAATKRFLRRYLLTPPPPEVCEAMATLVKCLKTSRLAIPPGTVPPLGKVLSLIRCGQASAVVFGELLQAISSTIMLLDIHTMQRSRDGTTWDTNNNLIDPLMTILEHESGMSAEKKSLKKRCKEALDAIENVISPIHHGPMTSDENSFDDRISDFGDIIPSGFLEGNEKIWRGRVQPSVVGDSYTNVKSAARKLANAVGLDFFGSSNAYSSDSLITSNESKAIKSHIIYDAKRNSNVFYIKEIPRWVANEDKDKYIHPRDKDGKLIKNRYTTEAVSTAISEYVSACEEARQAVSAALTRLSRDLEENGHIPAICQASHANLILHSAHKHAQQANALGWNCADVCETDVQANHSNEGHEGAAFFESVWPYWMQSSEAVQNSYHLNNMILLTAPNMSGKSTVMRASAAAALLSVCGLCAPLKPGSRIRRFDHLFVRGASADVPAEHKSAFGAEMLDIAALLRCCGEKSLVFVDELGRGTSPRDGTRLAGAVLEAMAKSGMSGFFATHLHDILHLPLESGERISKKQMAVEDEVEYDIDHQKSSEVHHYKWTYRLTDGVCTNSMALVTAAQFGLPQDVLARAEALSAHVPGGLASYQVSPNATKANAGNVVDPTVNGSQDSAAPVRKTTTQEHCLDSVIQMIVSMTGGPPFEVPPSWSPPASLEGRSCVYILQLSSNSRSSRRGNYTNGSSSSSGSSCTSPQKNYYYYVGETDSLQNRLRYHRSKGRLWSGATCLTFPVNGSKSEAREMESKLIRTMCRKGYAMKSTNDGRTIRPPRRHSG